MTNREICLKAAQRLREVGWRQGAIGPEEGPNCIVGACLWVTGYLAAPPTTLSAGPERGIAAADAAVVNASQTRRPATASFWNDTPGRTVEEVIATLDACP